MATETPGGAVRAVVGNDVVDLDHPAVRGMVTRRRFAERVLAPSERFDVEGAEDPDVALWIRWAAKEAAYKVVSKLRGKLPVFVHRAFVMRDDAVEFEDTRIPIRVKRSGDLLHVVAVFGDGSPAVEEAPLARAGAAWEGPLATLLERFTPREVDAVHSRDSAAVRLGARASLAAALEVEERRLEIVCAPGSTGRRPPSVLLDGAPAPADLSLSHHGRWIGWAFLLSGAAEGVSRPGSSAGS